MKNTLRKSAMMINLTNLIFKKRVHLHGGKYPIVFYEKYDGNF